MQVATSSGSRDQVEAFQRKHQTGLLTLVFTDLVGSMQLKQALGDVEGSNLIRKHHELVRATLAQFPDGEVVGTAGDSFFLVFVRPSSAVRFALQLQAGLGRARNQDARGLQERVGIHVGEVVVHDATAEGGGLDYYGLQVDTCARIMGLAAGGQVLLSRFAFDNARQVLKNQDLAGLGPVAWQSYGAYQFKGLDETLDVAEVGEVGVAPLRPPVDSEKAWRSASVEGEPVLGWRPAIDQVVPDTQWVLGEKLGEGGFGEVWVGRHQALQERRVFKFCFRADRVRSLKREVTLFRLLKERVGAHPNIVGVQDVNFEHPPFYLVMDYAPAQDLKQWVLAQGGAERVPMATRTEIIAQCADGLQAAHDAGIIHRDVKPGNILISPSLGRPEAPDPRPGVWARLTDFGIGQVVSAEHLQGANRAGFTMTMLPSGSSSQTGTQLYMAPELWAGQPASIRSDIYSLGVVLYQLLIGDFSQPLTTDWAQRIEDPLLRADLELCFAGDPARRFPGAAALANQLRSLESRRAALLKKEHEARAKERAAYRRGMARATLAAVLVIAAVTALALVAVFQGRMAVREKKRADAEAKAARSRLVNLNLERGARLMEAGDPLGSLLWYIESLKYAGAAPQEERLTRLRIANVMEAAPRLVHAYRMETEDPGLSMGDATVLLDLSGFGTNRVAVVREGLTGEILAKIPFPEVSALRIILVGQEWVLAARSGSGQGDFMALEAYDARSGRLTLTNRMPLGGRVCRRIATSPGSEDVQFMLSPTPGGDHGSGPKVDPAGQAGPVPELVPGRSPKAGTARLVCWQLGSNQFATVDLACAEPVSAEAVRSSRGDRILVLDGNGMRSLVDTRDGRLLAALAKPGASRLPCAFSRDGRVFLTGGADGRLEIRSAEDGLSVQTTIRHDDPITFAEFSPNGRLVVCASIDGAVRVWDTASGRPAAPVMNQSFTVAEAAFSENNRFLMLLLVDGTVQIWDAFSGDAVSPALRSPGTTRYAAFLGNGEHVLVGDAVACVWSLPRSLQVQVNSPGGRSLRWLNWSRDGTQLVSTAMRDTAEVRLASPTNPPRLTLRHAQRVDGARFSTDGKLILTSGPDGKRWEAASGRALPNVLEKTPGLNAIEFSADGRTALTISTSNVARIHDATSGEAKGPEVPFRGRLQWSSLEDQGRFAALTTPEEAWAWSTENASPPRPMPLSYRRPRFLPDGRHLALSTYGGMILWDPQTGKERELAGLQGRVLAMDWTPDGRWLAASDHDQNLGLFEGPELKPAAPLTRQMAPAIIIRFSALGHVLGSWGGDGTLRFWDIPSLRPRTPWCRDNTDPFDLQLSPDGQVGLAMTKRGRLRLWDTATGEPISPPRRLTDLVHEVWASPDRKHLVTRFQYVTEVWRMPIEPDRRPVGQLTEVAELLSSRRMDAAGAMSPLADDLSPEAIVQRWQTLAAAGHPEMAPAQSELAAWRRSHASGARADVSTLFARQPDSIAAPPGTRVKLQAEILPRSTLALQWYFEGRPLVNETNRILELKAVAERDYGSYQLLASSGRRRELSRAVLVAARHPQESVTGAWSFRRGDLSATLGHDLEFMGGPQGETAAQTRFGSSRSLGLPDLGGTPVSVMSFPAGDGSMGYLLRPGAIPQTGSVKVNRYTLIMDVLWNNPSDQRFASIIQIDDPENRNDGDLFVAWDGRTGGIGISEQYEGPVRLELGRWHRIAFVVDMQDVPGRIDKYIDGIKHGTQTGDPLRGWRPDGRFSLGPEALLFTDDSYETLGGFVGSIQIRDECLTEQQIKAFGGPAAEGIPWW